jgi:hypothetical protein
MQVDTGRNLIKTRFILYQTVGDNHVYPGKESPCVQMRGVDYKPESWHIICPDCGTLWATREVLPTSKHWTVRLWPCRDCGNGSLWDAWNKPWNLSLPVELLLREMEIIKGWFDEGIRTYKDWFTTKHLRRKC